MFKKSQSHKEVPITVLLLWVILVSLIISVWKSLGCIGFPHCYLCGTFTPDSIIDPLAISSITDDFTKLMNLKNFTFLINNYVCNKSDVLLLVLVHSDPYNYEKRLAIRRTWGNNHHNDKFKLLFMVGIPNSTVIQKRIQEENEAIGDLVQGNFKDTYRNLTYKHVMALKWAKYFCPKAKYVLKTDDDVFINSPRLLYYLNGRFPKTNLMHCLPVYQGRAQRSSRSKWRVTWTEYQFREYPPYCQGFAILYSLDVVKTLYAKAQVAKYFWVDDVFITGCLAMAANITPTTFGSYMLEPGDFRKLMNKENKDFPYLLGPYNLSVMDIIKLWEIAVKATRLSSGEASSSQVVIGEVQGQGLRVPDGTKGHFG